MRYTYSPDFLVVKGLLTLSCVGFKVPSLTAILLNYKCYLLLRHYCSYCRYERFINFISLNYWAGFQRFFLNFPILAEFFINYSPRRKPGKIWRIPHRRLQVYCNVTDFYLFLQYIIQHCFNCRPSDSTVSEDAGIEPPIYSLMWNIGCLPYSVKKR